jgi:hypothetical protein
MSSNDKTAALARIGTINAVEGFDPAPLAVEYDDLNTGEKRFRLPVMVQIAWFRLKYPEGRFTISVSPAKDCFVAVARVYRNYADPMDCFLSEASASRGFMPDKPTVSPREWAQTAALGIALRNAGFGLQFHAAGEGFDDSAINELGQPIPASPGAEAATPPVPAAAPSVKAAVPPVEETAAPERPPAEDPLDTAKKMPCPITKYKDKTLGDLILLDPKALVWVAEKFTGNPALKDAATLICQRSLEVSA